MRLCFIIPWMSTLSFIEKNLSEIQIPAELLKGKRRLTPAEISVLEDNLNTSDDGTWDNFYVDDDRIGFDPTLIKGSHFSGFVILGRLWPAYLKYHDLELKTGITNSRIRNVVTGNDNAISNVSYLENYRTGDRVMLFNIQEMSCTNHSKFGNGILKEGEPEKNRITIAVGNENGGREILPFEKMIPADAYIWSKFRADKALLEKLKEMTEKDFSPSLGTFGTVDDEAVIKNTTLIKDAKIGGNAYIKGAFKIKNVTIFSSPDEVSQIGEGVELVNGIVGSGSRIFYQSVAVRFVIGKNCQLKYGARLLNSVLGDNSTVSCCELLNNLIFPFHEQHHNSSFLISTTVLGQSNIAAGATIGSNHNSRSPDGEIIAGRGFWPGLCTNFKHNSRFASFVLASKGNYQHELDISYPFSLVAPSENAFSPVDIVPAWWFMYNTFAVVRNKYKFKSRDRRLTKVQNIETDPIAPDTVQEIISAVDRIITLTSERLESLDRERFEKAESKESLLIQAKDFLHSEPEKVPVLFDPNSQKKHGAHIHKAGRAYKIYRKVLKYFAAESLLEFAEKHSLSCITKETVKERIKKIPLHTKWRNVGGQIVPEKCLSLLIEKIKSGEIENWDKVHGFYSQCQENYTDYKARYSVFIIETMYSKSLEDFSSAQVENVVKDVLDVANAAYTSSYKSREKDYTDYYRTMVYDSREELEAVIGRLEDNDFLKTLKADIGIFCRKAEQVFGGLKSQ